MKMPKVSRCDVNQCAYNIDHNCHALAITIGDDEHPKCDTFTPGGKKAGDLTSTGGVGACKVSTCDYNRDLECAAPSIVVGQKQDEADCVTFEPRTIFHQ